MIITWRILLSFKEKLNELWVRGRVAACPDTGLSPSLQPQPCPILICFSPFSLVLMALNSVFPGSGPQVSVKLSPLAPLYQPWPLSPQCPTSSLLVWGLVLSLLEGQSWVLEITLQQAE